MPMSKDTSRSMGFLKKSLRMNAKATLNNVSQDGFDKMKLMAFAGHAAAMIAQIDEWEAEANAAAVTPAPVPQPTVSTYVTPPPVTGPIDPDDTDDTDDLLTV